MLNDLSTRELICRTPLARVVGDKIYDMMVKDEDEQMVKIKPGQVLTGDNKEVYYNRNNIDCLQNSSKVYFVLRGIVKEIRIEDLKKYAFESRGRSFTQRVGG